MSVSDSGVPCEILLASGSPRRQDLLRFSGWKFSVGGVEIDERPRNNEPPARYVARLSAAKARRAAERVVKGTIVIAADTAVVDQGAILGKPADVEEAAAMLRQLRGRTHQVLTAITLLRASAGPESTRVCVTRVPMRDYSDAEIECYVATGDPLDKAGAYGIQHPEFRPVERFDGCFANVMGLPLCELEPLLLEMGCQPERRSDLICPGPGQGECTIHQAVLHGQV